jgi:hypothetical protein
MNFEEFEILLKQDKVPEELSPLLLAMWHAQRNNWDAAHNIAQDIHSDDGSWIHAYLHRVEGDNGNALYWYRKAGRPMPAASLEKEWEEIVNQLLGRS